MVVNLISAALQLAVIYGIVNFGLVYLYRMTGVVNFAQGPMLMVSAFCVLVLSRHLGGLAPGIIGVVLAAVMVAAVLYAVLLHRLAGLPELSKVIATFMIGTALTELAGWIWGTDSENLNFPSLGYLAIGGGRIPDITLVTAGVLIVLVGAAEFFLMRTRLGLQSRAAALSGSLAVYYGIARHRLEIGAWAVALVCATLGGVVYAERVQVSTPISAVGFSAFPAAVIGGLDSVAGMLVGAVLVAAVQAVTSYYFAAEVSDAISFGLVLVALLLRPNGLLGRAGSNRL
jgi:branched-chain amino acid transport system permease protein